MSTEVVFHLFVYGSLRSGFQSPAYEYISRYFTLIAEGEVQGRLYDMGDYPAAVPAQDGSIIGELYHIKNENEFSYAIAQLDDYEGVVVESHEQPLYRRQLEQVNTAKGPVKAWMYWFKGDVTGRPAIPTRDINSYLNQKK